MRKLIICALTVVVAGGVACKKEKDRGCGCDTKEVIETLTAVKGTLYYAPARKSWGLVIPAGFNTNVRFSGEICNGSHPEVRKFIDTAGLVRPDIPVRVSVEIRDYCPDSLMVSPADIILSLFTVSKMERQ